MPVMSWLPLVRGGAGHPSSALAVGELRQGRCSGWLFYPGAVGGGEKHGGSWQVVSAQAGHGCDRR